MAEDERPITLLRWSSWSEWSSCSRTCGGGVRSRTRRCLQVIESKSPEVNKSDATCSGASAVMKRSQICNDQVCPRPRRDFRAVQCERYNERWFAGNRYSWEAFYDEENPCVLNCRPSGYHFYVRLNDAVIDGTPCKLLSSERGVCVDGKCQQVGCDDIVDGEQYDVCGICGGDNSTCRLVSGLFTKPFLQTGYNYIADIPEQACNVNISSLKKTSNLFALRFKNGTYFMSGDSVPVGGTSTTYAAGTVFTYYRRTKDGDSVFSPGPTSQPLELLLLYRQTNTGLTYEYRMPVKVTARKKDKLLSRHAKHAISQKKYDDLAKYDNSHGPSTNANSLDFPEPIGHEEAGSHSRNNEAFAENGNRSFKWAITSYTPCSRTCGEGTKIGVYSCVKQNDEDQIVADRKCVNEAIKKPDTPVLTCALSACPAEWTLGEWGPCSVTCGEGVERRDLVCARQISQQQKFQVDEKECASGESANLLRTRPCFRNPCDDGTSVQPYWSAGTWSACSARCGVGTKTRMVKCIADRQEQCSSADRPPAETNCDMGPCSSLSPAEWLITDWSKKCSVTCGSGIHTRKVVCSVSGKQNCSDDLKPESTRQCFSTDQCEAQWFAGPWSLCSADCGWGKQSRSLVCVAFDKNGIAQTIVADVNCTEKKPISEQACFNRECDAIWYFSDWSSCSRSCDSGIRTRRVRCLDENFAPDVNCKEEDKPSTKQVCGTERCPERSKFGGIESASLPLNASTTDDPNCTDSNSNCNLVLRTRLCSYKYYQQSCCRACSSSGMRKP